VKKITMKNDILQIITARRSIREFTDRRPDREMLERLIAAAVCAPSNHNRQGWKFVVFEDHDEISALAEQSRESVRQSIADSPRGASEHSERLIHYAGAFDQAPILILAMHKKSPAIGRAILTHAVDPIASGEALSTRVRDDGTAFSRRRLAIDRRSAARLHAHLPRNDRISGRITRPATEKIARARFRVSRGQPAVRNYSTEVYYIEWKNINDRTRSI